MAAPLAGAGEGPSPCGRVGVGSRGHARGVAGALAGRALPRLALEMSTGEVVWLQGECDLGRVIYLFPGGPWSPDGGSGSGLGDVAQHRAFERHREDLLAYCLTAVGVSSQPARVLEASRVEHRVGHELWSDPGLSLADAVGLPTFIWAGVRWYRRLVMVVRGGRVEKAFFPVASPQRSGAQVLWWLKLTGGR